MNERLIFENYLLVLKSTVEVFVHGTLESANTDVHDILKNGLDSIMEMQKETYDLMMQHSWYQVNNISTEEIGKTLNKLEK